MPTPDVLYTIVALSIAGGVLTTLVVDMVEQHVWAGRRRFVGRGQHPNGRSRR